MKKLIIILLFLACVIPSFGAFTQSITTRKTYKNSYRWTGRSRDLILDWAEEVEDRLTGASAIEFTLYTPTDSVPASNEGTLYYDLSESKLKYHNGSSFIAIESGSTGNSLDGAYDVGSSITVDASPVTLTTDTGSGIIALSIDHGGASNNSDGMAIAHAGSGDGIQVTSEDTDSVAMRLIAGASQTVSLAVFDAATSDWDGADDIGMVHINSDTALINAGASLLQVIHASAQPVSSAEGFLARFVSTGTARTNAHAVQIETINTQPALQLNNRLTITGADSATTLMAITGNDTSGNSDTATINHDGTGAGLKIIADGTTSIGLELASAASQTTVLALIDGTTGNWIGADDVGMLQLTKDTALNNAGSAMLLVVNTAQPVASAEGFLARFVSTGTATTSASAVEIEVPATQPAFFANGIVAISGQDNPGAALVQVTGIDTTGDLDTMTIDTSGAGNGLFVDQNEADSQGITTEPFANSTVASLEVDGDAAGWLGADDVGMVHLRNDIPTTNAGATLLLVDDSSEPISAAEGFLARFVHSGTARTNSSAVEIEVPATQPALALNGIMSITGQNSPGAVLVQIIGNDGTGNSNTMSINTEGTGDGFIVTCDDADSVAANFVAAASQTTSLVTFDGTTGSWLGANDVGMLHLTNDGALAHVDASLLRIANSGVPQDDSRGSSLRIVDTGNASAGTAGYAVYISATDATVEAMYIDDGNILVDEEIVAGVGVQSTATGRTATVGGASTGLIARNTRHVTITCDDATKQITLPAPIAGMVITLVTPALGVELIATGSSVKVNDVIVSATNEAALVADSHYEVTCVSATEWILVGYDKLGAHIAPIVPDSL